jgi:hypothetical protein
MCGLTVVELLIKELEDAYSCSWGIANSRVEFAVHGWGPGLVLFGRENEAEVYRCVIVAAECDCAYFVPKLF